MKLMEGKKQEKRAHQTIIVMLNQAEKEASGCRKGRIYIYIVSVSVLCLYKDVKVVGSGLGTQA